jgi:hypothetical protein
MTPMTTTKTTPGTARRVRGWVQSYGTDRPCAGDGCTTVLSRYNDSPLCWVHEAAGAAALRRSQR